jgi:hypothetical protein
MINLNSLASNTAARLNAISGSSGKSEDAILNIRNVNGYVARQGRSSTVNGVTPSLVGILRGQGCQWVSPEKMQYSTNLEI